MQQHFVRMIRCANDWRGYVRAPSPLGSSAGSLTRSSGSAVVVVQHAAQALAPLDHACFSKMARFWADESIGQALVIAFGVIMRHKLLNPFAQRALTEPDHALQTGFLDAAHESLGVRIQIRRTRRTVHRFAPH